MIPSDLRVIPSGLRGAQAGCWSGGDSLLMSSVSRLWMAFSLAAMSCWLSSVLSFSEASSWFLLNMCWNQSMPNHCGPAECGAGNMGRFYVRDEHRGTLQSLDDSLHVFRPVECLSVTKTKLLSPSFQKLSSKADSVGRGCHCLKTDTTDCPAPILQDSCLF